ncbi:hypothetical protein [Arthrobacter sp. NPDC089319]|uniref:hypothetical protein n=1 Tax=Arthrobacter sp. NPDC089319 TaxID=3155915 RepID=UPI003441211D
MFLAQFAQLAVATVVLAAVVFLTSYAVERGLRRSPDADTAFWYCFSGLCCALTVVLAAAALFPAAVPLWLLLAAGCAAPAVWRITRRASAAVRYQDTRDWHEAAARHDAARTRWLAYELDPALVIDYPDMSDVLQPETAAMLRAMKRADALRSLGPDNDGGAGAYPTAVAEATARLTAAERAAGRPPETGLQGPLPETGRDFLPVRRTSGR